MKGLCGKYDKITENDRTEKNGDIIQGADAVALSYATEQCETKRPTLVTMPSKEDVSFLNLFYY